MNSFFLALAGSGRTASIAYSTTEDRVEAEDLVSIANYARLTGKVQAIAVFDESPSILERELADIALDGESFSCETKPRNRRGGNHFTVITYTRK